MSGPLDIDRSLPPQLAHAFAPVHKRALGIAVGLVFGALVALVTAFHVVVQPAAAPPIELLGEYFYGYTVSWTGAAIGFFWAFVVGFVTGWFGGFTRNVALATWLLVLRTKADLSQPFLDHL